MAGWNFTADSVIQKTLAQTLNDEADKFDSKIGELYSVIESDLGSHWTGEDYDAFKTGTEGYKTALQDLSNGIRMFGKHFETLFTGTESLASDLITIITNATTTGASILGGASNSATSQGNLGSGANSNSKVGSSPTSQTPMPSQSSSSSATTTSPSLTINPSSANATITNNKTDLIINNQQNSKNSNINNSQSLNPIVANLVTSSTNKDVESSSNNQELANNSSSYNVSTTKKDINTDNVKSGTRVANALNKYSSELDSAEYAKVNENIFMTITPTKVDGNKCYLTHVVVNNPNQIFGEPANGQYASGLETATSAAKRLGAGTALVLNGSHFSYADGSEDLKGANHIVIVNGQIKTNGQAGGMEICLDKNGNLFNATPGTSAEELVNRGVVYTFSSHDSHLISNGNKTYEHQDNAYNSTVIGQKSACDYYILTGSTSNFGAADYLYDKGCTFAKSMDQGGSVSLVYNGQLINTPTDDSGERAIGDFLCISS